MLRYFIAWNLWFVSAALMILGCDHNRHYTGHYSVFGVGNLFDWQFWSMVATFGGLGLVSFVIWCRTLKSKVDAETRRGFELVPQAEATVI